MSIIDLVDIELDGRLDRIDHLLSTKKLVVAGEVNHACSATGKDRVIISSRNKVNSML